MFICTQLFGLYMGKVLKCSIYGQSSEMYNPPNTTNDPQNHLTAIGKLIKPSREAYAECNVTFFRKYFVNISTAVLL